MKLSRTILKYTSLYQNTRHFKSIWILNAFENGIELLLNWRNEKRRFEKFECNEQKQKKKRNKKEIERIDDVDMVDMLELKKYVNMIFVNIFDIWILSCISNNDFDVKEKGCWMVRINEAFQHNVLTK